MTISDTLARRVGELVTHVPRGGLVGSLGAAFTGVRESRGQVPELLTMVTWGSVAGAGLGAVSLGVGAGAGVLLGSLAVGALSGGANAVSARLLRPRVVTVTNHALEACCDLVVLAGRLEALEPSEARDELLEHVVAVVSSVIEVGREHRRAGAGDAPQVRAQQAEVTDALSGLRGAYEDLRSAQAKRREAFALSTGLGGSTEALEGVRRRVEEARSHAAQAKEVEDAVVLEVRRASTRTGDAASA